jgi:hypothetical protein
LFELKEREGFLNYLSYLFKEVQNPALPDFMMKATIRKDTENQADLSYSSLRKQLFDRHSERKEGQCGDLEKY